MVTMMIVVIVTSPASVNFTRLIDFLITDH
jgi:hypothetical protein